MRLLLIKAKWIITIIAILAILGAGSLENPDRIKRKPDFIFHGLKGLMHFNSAIVINSILIFLIMVLIIFLLGYQDQKLRKVIVKVSIDEQSKKVTLFTKDLLDKLHSVTANINEISIGYVSGEKESLAKGEFNCYIFKRKNSLIGRFYVNHYTWKDDTEINQIKWVIKEIKDRKIS